MKFEYLQVAQKRNVVSVSVAEESSSSPRIKKAATRRLTEQISVDSGFYGGCFEQGSSESAVKRFGR
jgi:hypothetical protein